MECLCYYKYIGQLKIWLQNIRQEGSHLIVEALKKVANALNSVGCTWAVGSSMLLYFHGLLDNPNDIDLLIKVSDEAIIKREMDKIGSKLVRNSMLPYKTTSFFAYEVDGVEVEFMGDFKIMTMSDNKEVQYNFTLDKKAIVDIILMDEVVVYLSSLEDWFVAYQIMKDPKGRVSLIEEKLKRDGIEHVELLERSLEVNLPKEVTNRIKELIKT